MSDKTLLNSSKYLQSYLTGVSTFPLWSSPLARTLHLSSSQINILASSAILAEYASAAVWGAIADSYGPGAVSIGAGGCFGIGYGLLGLVARLGGELDKQGKEINNLLWVLLCATYFLAGSGVAASYFSAVISSTKSAPERHSGLGEPPFLLMSDWIGPLTLSHSQRLEFLALYSVFRLYSSLPSPPSSRRPTTATQICQALPSSNLTRVDGCSSWRQCWP